MAENRSRPWLSVPRRWAVLPPEAQTGGPIGLVQDGDVITLDASKNEISVAVSDAEMAALRACRRLFLPKFLVADRLQRHVEHWLVIAAVIFERLKVLIDDLVLVRESIRRNQIAAANLSRIDLQLVRGQI